jgi:hypothetical protein
MIGIFYKKLYDFFQKVIFRPSVLIWQIRKKIYADFNTRNENAKNTKQEEKNIFTHISAGKNIFTKIYQS